MIANNSLFAFFLLLAYRFAEFTTQVLCLGRCRDTLLPIAARNVHLPPIFHRLKLLPERFINFFLAPGSAWPRGSASNGLGVRCMRSRLPEPDSHPVVCLRFS